MHGLKINIPSNNISLFHGRYEIISYSDYRFLSKLGEGTFSEVYKVKHRGTGQISALKKFKRSFRHSVIAYCSRAEIAENLREIQALKKLQNHEHIIKMEKTV